MAGSARAQQFERNDALEPAMLMQLGLKNEAAFEMESVRVVAGGLEISFTKAIGRSWVERSGTFRLFQWPNSETERDRSRKRDLSNSVEVQGAYLLDDGRSVKLELSNLRPGHVIYINVDPAMTSEDGEMLWSNEAYYSLTVIPLDESE